MSVPNSLGSDPENVASSETESQSAVPRLFLHEAGRSVLPAVGGIIEGNGLPCETFGTPNALDNSPEGRASDVKRRKPRVVWDNDAKKALVLQVWTMKPFTASHGQKGSAWEQISDALGKLDQFDAAGGVRADACKKQYEMIMKDHRRMVASGEWASGNRTGLDEELHRVINLCMEEEDTISNKRKEEEEDDATRERAREQRAHEPAESSTHNSSGRERLKRGPRISGNNEDRTLEHPQASLENAAAAFFAAKAQGPEAKRTKVELEVAQAEAGIEDKRLRLEEMQAMREILMANVDSPETRRRKVENEKALLDIRRIEAETGRLQAENTAAMLKFMEMQQSLFDAYKDMVAKKG